MTMRLVAVAVEDGADLVKLLSDAGLPTEDVGEPGQVFLHYVEEEGELVGVGGYEMLGDCILLRSIGVVPDRRGRGIGSTIAEDLMRRSGEDGAGHAFAFTIGERSFLSALGFERTERAAAPAVVLDTRQARGLCSASAVLWRKEIIR